MLPSDLTVSNDKKHPVLVALENDGFTILPKVFDDETLKQMRKLTDEIIEYSEMGLEDPFSNYYMRHRADNGVLYDLFYRHPEFQALARNPKILDAMELVLGKDIFLYENSLVYKPRGKPNEVPWHQDFINRSHEPIKYIAWIAFDPVTIENGAMKILPGSHKNGFMPFFHVPGETHHTRLKLDGIDLNNYRYAEMNPGDVLVFHQLVIHSSDRIESQSPRRAYRFACQGFETIFTPRATPVVLRGGHPSSLMTKFPNKYSPPPPPAAPAPVVEPVAIPTPQVAAPSTKVKIRSFLGRVKRKLMRVLKA